MASLQLNDTALILWERKFQGYNNLGNLLSSWSNFITALKDKFYPLGYKQKSLMEWQYLRQGKGQNVESFTEEFRKQALSLSISLDSPEVVTKYIGSLHSFHHILDIENLACKLLNAMSKAIVATMKVMM